MRGCHFLWRMRTRPARWGAMRRTRATAPGQVGAGGGITFQIPQTSQMGVHGLGGARRRTWSVAFDNGGEASPCYRAPSSSENHRFRASSQYHSHPGCRPRRTLHLFGCQPVVSPSDRGRVLHHLPRSWSESSATFPVQSSFEACSRTRCATSRGTYLMPHADVLEQLLYTTFITAVLLVIAIVMLVGVTQQLLLGANSWIILDCMPISSSSSEPSISPLLRGHHLLLHHAHLRPSRAPPRARSMAARPRQLALHAPCADRGPDNPAPQELAPRMVPGERRLQLATALPPARRVRRPQQRRPLPLRRLLGTVHALPPVPRALRVVHPLPRARAPPSVRVSVRVCLQVDVDRVVSPHALCVRRLPRVPAARHAARTWTWTWTRWTRAWIREPHDPALARVSADADEREQPALGRSLGLTRDPFARRDRAAVCAAQHVPVARPGPEHGVPAPSLAPAPAQSQSQSPQTQCGPEDPAVATHVAGLGSRKSRTAGRGAGLGARMRDEGDSLVATYTVCCSCSCSCCLSPFGAFSCLVVCSGWVSRSDGVEDTYTAVADGLLRCCIATRLVAVAAADVAGSPSPSPSSLSSSSSNTPRLSLILLAFAFAGVHHASSSYITRMSHCYPLAFEQLYLVIPSANMMGLGQSQACGTRLRALVTYLLAVRLRPDGNY